MATYFDRAAGKKDATKIDDLWAEAGVGKITEPTSRESASTDSEFRAGSAMSGTTDTQSSAGGDGDKVRTDDEAAREKADESLIRKLLDRKMLACNPERMTLNAQSQRLLQPKTTWVELHVPSQITRGLIANGFDNPSTIQSVALEILFKGRNLIAQSQSGTGKTVAFVIGMLHRTNPEERFPQAIVLEPTFELAKQTASVIREIIHKLPITVMEAVRGVRPDRGTSIQDHIIVGTPGTVLDWMTRYKFFDPKKIKVFVLDEADVMIAQQGHQDQSVRIFKMMDAALVQTALFSATYEESVMNFAKRVVRDAEVITVAVEDLSLENIHQYYIKAHNDEEKMQVLRNLYGIVTVDNAMVFCRSREIAHRIYDTLKPDGHPIGILAGDMTIEQRADAIEQFRKGSTRLLITTNVSARGIDVMAVNLVVNFDMPLTHERKPDFETYIHRIGRTGRWGRGGLAINFVKDDNDMRIMKAFQEHFKRDILPLDHTDIDKMEELNQKTA